MARDAIPNIAEKAGNELRSFISLCLTRHPEYCVMFEVLIGLEAVPLELFLGGSNLDVVGGVDFPQRVRPEEIFCF